MSLKQKKGVTVMQGYLGKIARIYSVALQTHPVLQPFLFSFASEIF